jgi:hypothetical protein
MDESVYSLGLPLAAKVYNNLQTELFYVSNCGPMVSMHSAPAGHWEAWFMLTISPGTSGKSCEGTFKLGGIVPLVPSGYCPCDSKVSSNLKVLQIFVL